MEPNDTIPDAQSAPETEVAPVRARPRGRTTAIVAAAALLGIAGGTAVGYGIQAERAPTPLPALSQADLAYPGEGPYEKAERAEITQWLDDFALRHVAARGWTMPDGTSSLVYLPRST